MIQYEVLVLCGLVSDFAGYPIPEMPSVGEKNKSNISYEEEYS